MCTESRTQEARFWGMLSRQRKPFYEPPICLTRQQSYNPPTTTPSNSNPVVQGIQSAYRLSSASRRSICRREGMCLVLNHETRKEWIISFTLWPHYLSRRSVWDPLGRAPVSHPRSNGEEKPFLLPEIKLYRDITFVLNRTILQGNR
jgi:hypothetical protein